MYEKITEVLAFIKTIAYRQEHWAHAQHAFELLEAIANEVKAQENQNVTTTDPITTANTTSVVTEEVKVTSTDSKPRPKKSKT